MEVSIKAHDSYTLVALKGRLNTTNFSELESKINDLITKGNHTILVDCEGLEYVSSSGLRVFLVALKTLKKLNGKFVLCNLQDEVLEVFEVSGFITIFDVCTTMNEAIGLCNN